MNEEFYQRFGRVELGPENWPEHGRVLYERVGSALTKRYTLESSGWSIDTKSGERAFRLDDESRVFLPSGQEIARPGPLPAPKAGDPARRLYGDPASKPGELFSELRSGAPWRPRTRNDAPLNLAQRMFGGGK